MAVVTLSDGRSAASAERALAAGARAAVRERSSLVEIVRTIAEVGDGTGLGAA